MHDLIIIGAGPGGISAAIYAKRYNLDVLLIEKEMLFGGKVLYPHWIENFIGIPEGISGAELSDRLQKHAISFQVPFKHAQIVALEYSNNSFQVMLSNQETIKSKTVLLANGTTERLLNIPGEKEYKGKGVSYCATCDAPFFKNKTLAVIGGGDSALAEILYLTEFASRIHLIHRRKEFRGSEHLVNKLNQHPSLQQWLGYTAKEIHGNNDQIQSIFVENTQSNKTESIPVDGLFIFAGYEPDTSFLKLSVPKDEKGYILTNEEMETTVPGLYAAGDIRSKSFRQIITALSDGATAAHAIRNKLKS